MDAKTELLINAELSEYKTNHLLHLLLSIITMGLWLIVWVIVSISNSSERRKIKKRLGMVADKNRYAAVFFTALLVAIYSVYSGI